MGLRTDIIRLLNSRDATLTDFTLFGHRVSGQDYRRIANSIQNGHIQIVRSRLLASTRAKYELAYNAFTVGATPSPSLIVHEATHAINDWHGRTLDPAIDECLAYVAQMIYVCRLESRVQREALTEQWAQRTRANTNQCRVRIRDNAPNLSVCTNSTIGFATIVAATLRNGLTPSQQLLRDLRQALGRDPDTLHPNRVRRYDRIHRFEIPAEDLERIQGELVTD